MPLTIASSSSRPSSASASSATLQFRACASIRSHDIRVESRRRDDVRGLLAARRGDRRSRAGRGPGDGASRGSPARAGSRARGRAPRGRDRPAHPDRIGEREQRAGLVLSDEGPDVVGRDATVVVTKRELVELGRRAAGLVAALDVVVGRRIRRPASASSAAAPGPRVMPRSRASRSTNPTKPSPRGGSTCWTEPPAAATASASRFCGGKRRFARAARASWASITASPLPVATFAIAPMSASRSSFRFTNGPGFRSTTNVPPPNIVAVVSRSAMSATVWAAGRGSAHGSQRSRGMPVSTSSAATEPVDVGAGSRSRRRPRSRRAGESSCGLPRGPGRAERRAGPGESADLRRGDPGCAADVGLEPRRRAPGSSGSPHRRGSPCGGPPPVSIGG